MASMSRGRYELLAIVTGTPVELEAPKGFFEKRKKRSREEKVQEQREILLINLHPADADRIEEAVRESLGRPVELVDDKVAVETLWS
jgi:hypothetical protein